ncbi:MAG: polyphosphate kinase 1 [Cellvibrionaceae bacterium]
MNSHQNPPEHLPEQDQIALDNPEYYINRELSHLQFNARVLHQATDENIPLLERMKFLLIFSSNMDEFFEIRVAGLKQGIQFGRETTGPDSLHASETLRSIYEESHKLVENQYALLNDQLLPALASENIHFLRRHQWSETQREWIKNYFHTNIQPVISPIGLDPAHPFPRLVNKSLNFIVGLEGMDAFGREIRMAIVPAPRSLPRIIRLPDETCDGGDNFVFLSSMIHEYADELFPGMEVNGCYQFRTTRNADLDMDTEGVADLARALRGELHSRRFGTAVRLEVADNCPEEMIQYLRKEFKLEENECYRVNGPVNLMRLFAIFKHIHRAELQDPPFTPGKLKTGGRSKDDIFGIIAKRDALLLHPYQSFTPVIDLLRSAAKDPNVLAIKQTLYRSGDDSEIVQALVDAARNGKEVTTVVELRARFDEEENLELATRLQEAGAVVVYGVVEHKTHAKMILIVRREGDSIRRYVHVGTGNYHAGNARIYTDYSLLSANQDLGSDIHSMFQQLTGMGRAANIHKILHAPFTLKRSLIKMIDGEIKAAQEGKPARIIAKCNGITEPKVIQALYKASQAGVKIDLIIRGMCSLRPGVPGVSENIRVRSIIGRFLEHTRVYYFKNASQKLWCASADLMERNLNNRVEICFPIEEKRLFKRVKEDLEICLADNTQSWELQTDGNYILNTPKEGETPRNCQKEFLESLAQA